MNSRYLAFAQNLELALHARGMSQKELASKSGITPSAISRYLSGERDPGLSCLARIVRVLGVSADSLLGLSEEKNTAEVLPSLHTEVQDMSLAIRKATGWSQYALADAVGTTQTEISFLEKGFIPPASEKIRRLHELYHKYVEQGER